MLRLLTFILLIAILLPAAELRASDWQQRAHAKYRLSSLHYSKDSALKPPDSDSAELHSFDLRAATAYRGQSFEFELDAELLALGGSGLESNPAMFDSGDSRIGEGRLPDDQRRVMRLSEQFISDEKFIGTARIDRAAIAYLGDNITFRLGRQALTLGNGLAFHVFDLVNPFSPFSIDKEYKTGDDLAYVQYLLSDQDSIQVAIVPRRDPISQDIEQDQSTALMMFHSQSKAVSTDLTVIAARHYGDWLAGLGFNRNLFEGILRADIRVTRFEPENSYSTSAVINFDRSWYLFDKNLYGFVEYFRNGIGQADLSFQSLQSDQLLLEQLERGESFTLGRDLLAIGSRAELHPLINLHLAAITNLNDGSTFLQNRLEFDIIQDLIFTIGSNIPLGGSNTEFGGITLPNKSKTSSPFELYSRIAWYL